MYTAFDIELSFYLNILILFYVVITFSAYCWFKLESYKNVEIPQWFRYPTLTYLAKFKILSSTSSVCTRAFLTPPLLGFNSASVEFILRDPATLAMKK